MFGLENMKLYIFFDVIRTVFQLVLPDRCRVCGNFISQDHGQAICNDCLGAIKYLTGPSCICCGRAIKGIALAGQLCGHCLKTSQPWDRCLSLVHYGQPVSELLHRLKYLADTTVMPTIKSIVAEAKLRTPLKELRQPDLVVPVPLHPDRLKGRGLNQSVYIARAIFDKELVNHALLCRHKATIPQTGLTGVERRRNLRGAFEVIDKTLVKGKSICVVDDVFTTGTTVGECCRALKKGGATEVYVVTLARVVIDR